MKMRHFAATLFATCLSPLALSATDGSLGATSEGDTDVSITIGDVVQVRVEGDLPLTYTPGSPSSNTTGICVYRNSDADVNVTLTSDNPDGSDNFRMADGTNFLVYSVDFTGTTTSVVGATSGAANTISDENFTSSTCGGGFSHTLGVTATAVDLDAAPAGSYSDTITILAEPI